MADWLTDAQAPGLGGSYKGLGQQPREAIGTAKAIQITGVGATTVGGNYHAFMPPPDKFLVINLYKVAPINRPNGRGTRASNNKPTLAGTRAPVGNG